MIKERGGLRRELAYGSYIAMILLIIVYQPFFELSGWHRLAKMEALAIVTAGFFQKA